MGASCELLDLIKIFKMAAVLYNRVLFNCVTCDRPKNYTMEVVKLITNDYDTFTQDDINRSTASLCCNKACGIDVLFAEHLLHASPEIHVFFFRSVLTHSLFMGVCLIP